MHRWLGIFLVMLPLMLEAQIQGSGNSVKENGSEAASAPAMLEDENSIFRLQELKKTYLDKRSRFKDKYSKEIDSQEQLELDKILNEIAIISPDSYTFHYLQYIHLGYNESAFFHLKKAYEIYPDNVELFDDFMAYYELENDLSSRKKFSLKLYESNTISSEILLYNQNVLSALEPHAILLTNGTIDTYPCWILQDVKNIRPDVTIINLDLIQVKSYQQKKLKSLNIYPLQAVNPVDIVLEIAKKNPGRPINIALTVNQVALKKLQEQLYVTGLSLKYSTQKMDNLNVLRNNWEYKFNREYLENRLKNQTESQLHLNYILPLSNLFYYYLDLGEKDKAEKVKKIGLKLADEAGKLDLVSPFFESKP